MPFLGVFQSRDGGLLLWVEFLRGATGLYRGTLSFSPQHLLLLLQRPLQAPQQTKVVRVLVLHVKLQLAFQGQLLDTVGVQALGVEAHGGLVQQFQ